MIWQYFPVGLRFPVRDFSDETKRACWETALSALIAADATGVTLYDAQQTYDVGSGSPVYLCIACYYGIKQARACSKKLFDMDDLLIRLCRSAPFFQANALESFGPYPILGKIEQDGAVSFTEAGETVLKGVVPKPHNRQSGMHILLVSDADEAEDSAERCTRTLGIAAAKAGLSVSRTFIADGGFGTLRALVAAKNGRYESVTVTDAAGERRDAVIGVLPGSVAVLEAAGRDMKTVAELIKKTLDLGYRKIDLAAAGCTDPENAALVTEAPDPRLSECECRYICDEPDGEWTDALASIGFKHIPGAEIVLNTIDYESALKDAEFVVLHTHRALSTAAQAALSECGERKKPTCLLCSEPIDADRLMRENPVLRGVVMLDGRGEGALKRAWTDEVLPMIGKDVAKAARI